MRIYNYFPIDYNNEEKKFIYTKQNKNFSFSFILFSDFIMTEVHTKFYVYFFFTTTTTTKIPLYTPQKSKKKKEDIFQFNNNIINY